MRGLYALIALVLLAAPASAVEIEWMSVGAPGNAEDDSGYGAVAYPYLISKYEVTNHQYAEFLDAVAASDPSGLYNESMGSSDLGGIFRNGTFGSFSYTVKSGFASKPVNFVSFYDALRFVNWLHNGQPTGAQSDATTEDGSYTITSGGIDDNSITRNEEGTVFLTDEDEWYKAAYYDDASDFYFTYPTTTTVAMKCVLPTDEPFRANCSSEVGAPTDVGAYTGSPGPWGTFDQGGNIYEWTERIVGDRRSGRGGSFFHSLITLRKTIPTNAGPLFEGDYLGFRVSSVPEPGFLACGVTAVAITALARRRARRGRRLGCRSFTPDASP